MTRQNNLTRANSRHPHRTCAMDATKQEFNLRNLGTKSVTLFPSCAQITRELKDVYLVVSTMTPLPDFFAPATD